MKNKNKVLLISSFVINILLIISVVFIVNDKTSTLKTVKNTNEVKNKQFAVMLQNESGGYAESESSSWPTTGYELNTTLTNCTDETGTKIENVLRYENGNIAVKSNKKLYCYLYFDSLSGLCTSGSKLGSCLIEKNNKISSLNDNIEGGLYRYQGTNEVVNNNYICFGTSNKEECVNDTDKYMYRIIGVNESGQLKLIKKEALNIAYYWHNVRTSDITWPNSDLYKGLNGISGGTYSNLFIGNSTYVPNGWNNKIANTTWKYGNVTDINENAASLYATEYGWTSTTSVKIGLMYTHDYAYAYQSGGNNCSSSGEYGKCNTSWLHLSNNDSGAPSADEWTMSHYGKNGTYYYAWRVFPGGDFDNANQNNEYAVRPVFYLSADEVFASGMGTEDDPIMLRENASATIIRKDTESDIGLRQTIITGDDLYRFSGTQGNTGINNYICLGTTSKCASGSDNMYRIIGVNPNNGEIKVIKETPWNNKTGYAWHSSNTNATWLTSTLYTGTLNGIYDNLSFKDMIVTNHSWNVGTANSASIATRASAIDYENNTTGTANIGILSLTDFYLAYNGDRNWYTNYDLTTNWIGGYLNKNVTKNEWTMTYFGSDTSGYSSWMIRYDLGNSTRGLLTASHVIRPVFYLDKDVYITNPEATGSSTDPFILAY